MLELLAQRALNALEALFILGRLSRLALQLPLQPERIAALQRNGGISLLPEIMREAQADFSPHADADDELFLGQIVSALLQFQGIQVLSPRQRAALKGHFIADVDELDLILRQRGQFFHSDFLFRLPSINKSGHIHTFFLFVSRLHNLVSYSSLYHKEGEIVEKKSRFIATVRPIETEEEAVAFVNEMKKKYWDARHNCSAFVIGSRQEVTRCSDDGEPAQTAGRPMLDVLLREGITNVAVVVTRYFGGVLLGTGGLVRAYQSATQAGLAASKIIEKRQGKKLIIHTDYNGLGKLQYLFGQQKTAILDTEYAADVVLTILVPVEQKDFLYKEIIEQTNGTAQMEWGEDAVYALIDKTVQIF